MTMFLVNRARTVRNELSMPIKNMPELGERLRCFYGIIEAIFAVLNYDSIKIASPSSTLPNWWGP